jgi:hypothetical protein
VVVRIGSNAILVSGSGNRYTEYPAVQIVGIQRRENRRALAQRVDVVRLLEQLVRRQRSAGQLAAHLPKGRIGVVAQRLEDLGAMPRKFLM